MSNIINTEYDYVIVGFLPTDSEILRQLIISQPSLASTFLYLDSDGTAISVFFSSPLPVQVQPLLDGIMSGYMSSVPVAKAKKLSALQVTVNNCIDAHYTILARTQLMNLYTLAVFDGLTNRAAYIRPGIDWLNSILAYATSSAAAINALTTVADVQSYVIDINANVSADPLLTVGTAINISN